LYTVNKQEQAMSVYKELEDYAMRNYEAGGHWVVESFEKADYDEYLAQAKGRVNRAKRLLKEFWELKEELCRDVRGHGGCLDGDY